MAEEPAFQIWIDALIRFGAALRGCGERARRLVDSTVHSPTAHAVIADELTACVLGARKRPELEGDFEEPE